MASKIDLVINRHDLRNGIPVSEIENVVRHKVTAVICNDHEAVAVSFNRGQPVITHQPQRIVSKDIMRLAETLMRSEEEQEPAAARTRRPTLSGLFARFPVQHSHQES